MAVIASDSSIAARNQAAVAVQVENSQDKPSVAATAAVEAAWSVSVQSSSWAGPSPGQQLSCDAGTASTTGSAAVMIFSSVSVAVNVFFSNPSTHRRTTRKPFALRSESRKMSRWLLRQVPAGRNLRACPEYALRQPIRAEFRPSSRPAASRRSHCRLSVSST